MADILNHSTLTTSLVSYWKMEETSGTREDIHGSNDLTAGGTGGVGSGTGKIGTYAADFERSESDFLEKTSPTGCQTGNGARSFSMWVKFENLTAATWFLCGHGDTGVNQGFSYGLYMSSGSSQVFYFDMNGSNLVGSNNLSMSAGTWYHLVYTYDGTDHIIYKDGSSVETKTKGADYNTSNASLMIGSRCAQLETNAGHDGLIDEVGYWTKKLTSSEITDLYNGGAGLPYEETTSIKTVNGLAYASVKTVNGLAIASVKNINGLA